MDGWGGDWCSGVGGRVCIVFLFTGGRVRRGRRAYVYSREDMKVSAFPAVMGTSAMRRVVTGRRFPASGMSRNWRVQLGCLLRRVVEGGFGWWVDG